MPHQLFLASGYLSIFLVPVLLVIGVAIGEPWLAFATVMLLFPFMRLVLGEHERSPVLWRESVATLLDGLPVLYGVFLLGVVALVLEQLRLGAIDQPAVAIGAGFSLWITMLLATCPAHELVHRRRNKARLGRWIAGIAGYPFLATEHLVHHARSGDTAGAEWPRVDESVWAFAARRIRVALASAVRRDLSRRSADAPRLTRHAEPYVVTAATWAAFATAGGWTGFFLYLAVIVGVAFGVQLMTYLQHWGLGNDSVADAGSRQLGWEDGCRFQAWVTLHISFHQAHHRSNRTPFYRLDMSDAAPRLPSCYVVLMVLCLLPPLWRHLMLPALAYWKAKPQGSFKPGRRLSCFNLYGREPVEDVNR